MKIRNRSKSDFNLDSVRYGPPGPYGDPLLYRLDNDEYYVPGDLTTSEEIVRPGKTRHFTIGICPNPQPFDETTPMDLRLSHADDSLDVTLGATN